MLDVPGFQKFIVLDSMEMNISQTRQLDNCGQQRKPPCLRSQACWISSKHASFADVVQAEIPPKKTKMDAVSASKFQDQNGTEGKNLDNIWLAAHWATTCFDIGCQCKGITLNRLQWSVICIWQREIQRASQTHLCGKSTEVKCRRACCKVSQWWTIVHWDVPLWICGWRMVSM